MKSLNDSNGMDLVRRYLWFITHGIYTHVLNDPKVIKGEASPEYVDRLIQRGMEQWPQGLTDDETDDDEPRVA